MNKITIFIYFKRRALLYGLMICFFAIYTAKEGTTYTATGGNWSNNSSWSPSTGHPVAGDIAIIPKAAANKITVDVNSTCANVQMGVSGSGGIASLTFSPGVTLTITGSLDFESGVGGTVTVNKGILNVGTSVTVPTSNSAYKITVTTGSAILNTAAHTLTIPASATGV